MSKESTVNELRELAEHYEKLAEQCNEMADALEGTPSKPFAKASNNTKEKSERWGRGELLEKVKELFVKNGNAPAGVNDVVKEIGDVRYQSVYNIMINQNADQFEETKDGYRLTRAALKEAKESQAVVLK